MYNSCITVTTDGMRYKQMYVEARLIITNDK